MGESCEDGNRKLNYYYARVHRRDGGEWWRKLATHVASSRRARMNSGTPCDACNKSDKPTGTPFQGNLVRPDRLSSLPIAPASAVCHIHTKQGTTGRGQPSSQFCDPGACWRWLPVFLKLENIRAAFGVSDRFQVRDFSFQRRVVIGARLQSAETKILTASSRRKGGGRILASHGTPAAPATTSGIFSARGRWRQSVRKNPDVPSTSASLPKGEPRVASLMAVNDHRPELLACFLRPTSIFPLSRSNPALSRPRHLLSPSTPAFAWS